MITTVDTKRGRFNGLFQTGNPHSSEVVFMMGSCRGVPHLNFLNTAHNGRFKIFYVDPHDFHWDAHNNLVDLYEAIDIASKDSRITRALESSTIFIHEHYSNYGMFNTNRAAEVNIYDHGMAAPIDICLPNFHGKFILFQEILNQHRGKIGMAEMAAMGRDSISAFKDMCAHTSFPEFAQYFEDNMRRVRMFFSNNHVSHHFTIPLFRMMNEKYLGLPLTDEFYDHLHTTPDMYANFGIIPLTQPDVDAHGWQWDEPLQELKL